MKEEFARLQARWDANAPWNYLFTLSTSPLSDQTSKYALAQVRIDEARIAVALERYRLAHGDYPESLEVLAPAFIAALPHDVMNGAAYHYKLQKDGSYLLYSVGWNQKDDGGAVAYKQGLPEDVPPRVDYEQGDWPWVMPK